MKNTFLKFVFVALAATGFISQNANAQGTIVDELASRDSFSTLVSLVTDANLAGTLAGGQYTVFAPTNDAFANLGTLTIEDDMDNISSISIAELLSIDPALAYDILAVHVVPGGVDPSAAAGTRVGTLPGFYQLATGGWPMWIGSGGDTFGGTNIVDSISASNGTIYVIDEVATTPPCPADAEITEDFDMLVPCLFFFDLEGFRDSVGFAAAFSISLEGPSDPITGLPIFFELSAFNQTLD